MDKRDKNKFAKQRNEMDRTKTGSTYGQESESGNRSSESQNQGSRSQKSTSGSQTGDRFGSQGSTGSRGQGGFEGESRNKTGKSNK